MIKNLKCLVVFGATALISCSSVPKTGVENAGQETVVSRIDDLGSRPNWVREAEPFAIKDGQVTSLGMTTLAIDNRVEAAYRIAENNAKAGIANAIEQKLEFVFQNAEEGAGLDSTQARYIGAEVSKLTTSTIRMGKRYWEKVSTVLENGQPSLRYRVFALATMPEAEFKSAIVDAAKRAQGKGGLSADFAKKVDGQWDRFVSAPESATQTSAANR